MHTFLVERRQLHLVEQRLIRIASFQLHAQLEVARFQLADLRHHPTDIVLHLGSHTNVVLLLKIGMTII